MNNIPDEAIEEALRELFPQKAVSDFNRGVWTPTIKTILEAAAAHLIAEAKEKAFIEGVRVGIKKQAEYERGPSLLTNPYRSLA